MADISVHRKHGMDFDTAKRVTLEVVNTVKGEFPSLVDKIKWNSEKTAANVQGKGFKGEFAVDRQLVKIDISLSLFAKPFKGKVESKINERLDEIFAKNS